MRWLRGSRLTALRGWGKGHTGDRSKQVLSGLASHAYGQTLAEFGLTWQTPPSRPPIPSPGWSCKASPSHLTLQLRCDPGKRSRACVWQWRIQSGARSVMERAAGEWETRRWLNYNTSQSRTPASTSANCCPVSLPRNRSALTAGTVTGFCTRNAPGLRNGTLIGTSRSEPRKDVVCGITLMSARSESLHARLRIRAGRGFWTMPRSTSQTSPRLGTRLLLV